MAIIQGQTTSFKTNLYQQYFLNSGYTFAIALYTSSASPLDNTVTAYTTNNEVVGSGYTAGGNAATVSSVNFDLTSGTAFVTFNNVVWTPANFTASAGLIYNTTVGLNNESIAVIDFGQRVTCLNTFTIVMPGNTYTTALIRSV